MSTVSKTGIIDMDEKILSYSKFLETVSDKDRPNLQSKLLTAKLMREKFVAMTAFAKAQSIIAEMEVMVAENNLKNACEQLDKFKNELDKKTEKPKSLKTKDSQKELKISKSIKESRSIDKENVNKTSQVDTDKKSHKSQSKDEKSKKRRSSDTSHSSSKKSKLSPETKSSKSLKKCTKSKTSVPSPIKLNKITNNLEQPMEIGNNLVSIIGDDEDTILIENLPNTNGSINILTNRVKEIPSENRIENQKSSKIQILFEEDVEFRTVKMEAASGEDNIDNTL